MADSAPLTKEEIRRLIGWFECAENGVVERGGGMSPEDNALEAKLKAMLRTFDQGAKGND